jgi:hypothetical protein
MANATQKLTVNIEAANARQVFFFPLNERLQSTIRPGSLKKIPEWLRDIGDIPGDQVEVEWNTDSKGLTTGTARVVSRLAADPAKLAEIKRLSAQDENRMGAVGDPRPTLETRLHTGDDVASWLWHLMRLVESGQAVVVSGNVPSRPDIRALGAVRYSDDIGRQAKPGYPEIGRLPQITPTVAKAAAT